MVRRFLPGPARMALIGSMVWILSGARAWAQQPADTILHNGKILTVDNSFSTAQAVAVRGGKFDAVGRNEDILKMAGPNTLVIDLKGRTVIPGLIDTHTHIHDYSEGVYGGNLKPEDRHRYPVDWKGVRSKEDVLNQIKLMIEKYQFKPTQWVYFVNQLSFTGGGGSAEQAKILYDDLTRYDLDKLAPNTPVVLSMGIPDFNGFLLNSKAIDIIWNQMGYADFIKKYGRVWVDQTGKPDGHIEPPASRIVGDFILDRDPKILAPLYKQYDDELAAAGVTSVSTRLPKEALKSYQLLNSQGQLTLRMGYGMEWAFGTVKNPKTDMKQFQGVVGSGDDHIWVTSVAPTAVDGATTRACTNQKRLSAYGAVDSYWPLGQCHTDIEFNGAAKHAGQISGNYFKDWTMEQGLQGVRFANTHVAGDRSVANLLAIVEDVQKQKGAAATKNWAFDHCFLVNPADLPKAAKLGVAFSCAPKYIESAAAAAKTYGDKVANTFMVPVKSMVDAGVKTVLETDRDTYTWYDMEILLTRKDRDGKVWGAQEKLDKTTVLKMTTRWAAEYVLRPDKIGSIEPGKYADLAVLDRDYMTIPDEQVSDIHPQLTMLEGKVIYLHPDFAQQYNLKPGGAVIATLEDLKKRRTGRGGADF